MELISHCHSPFQRSEHDLNEFFSFQKMWCYMIGAP